MPRRWGCLVSSLVRVECGARRRLSLNPSRYHHGKLGDVQMIGGLCVTSCDNSNYRKYMSTHGRSRTMGCLSSTPCSLPPTPHLSTGTAPDTQPPPQKSAGCASQHNTQRDRRYHRWRARIEHNQITINGVPTPNPNHLLSTRCTLAYHRPPWAEPDAPHSLDVLYADAHMVAVNKPAGLQVLPGGPFHQRCTATLLRWAHNPASAPLAVHAPHLVGARLPPTPVHRLGRGTSGVLLCACSLVRNVLLLCSQWKTRTCHAAGCPARPVHCVCSQDGGCSGERVAPGHHRAPTQQDLPRTRAGTGRRGRPV